MPRKQIRACILFVAFICAAHSTNILQAQQFSIPWHTIDSGGGYSAGGNFELNCTIGQHDAGAVMTGGSFELCGGFWCGASVPIPDTVYPLSFQIITGSLDAGGVPELLNSDDQYLVMDPVFSAFRYQLVFTVDTVSSTLAPSALQFNMESKTFNIVGYVDQKIELFNYNTGRFETVDTRQANLFSDLMVTVTPGGDPTRFVEAGTGAMQARIRYENGLPFWVFFISGFFLPFETSVDQIFWSVTP